MHTELNKKEFEESKQKTLQSTLSKAEISFYYSQTNQIESDVKSKVSKLQKESFVSELLETKMRKIKVEDNAEDLESQEYERLIQRELRKDDEYDLKHPIISQTGDLRKIILNKNGI